LKTHIFNFCKKKDNEKLQRDLKKYRGRSGQSKLKCSVILNGMIEDKKKGNNTVELSPSSNKGFAKQHCISVLI
jgi:hypothetical protein